MQHFSTPPGWTARRDWSTSEVFIEIFDFQKGIPHGVLEPKTQNGKHPHGSKKSQIENSSWGMLFFCPDACRIQVLGAQNAFCEKRCSEILCMGVWVVWSTKKAATETFSCCGTQDPAIFGVQ